MSRFDMPRVTKYQKPYNPVRELVEAAKALGDSIAWMRVELPEGQSGFALIFPDENWEVVDETLRRKNGETD